MARLAGTPSGNSRRRWHWAIGCRTRRLVRRPRSEDSDSTQAVALGLVPAIKKPRSAGGTQIVNGHVHDATAAPAIRRWNDQTLELKASETIAQVSCPPNLEAPRERID